LDEKYYLLTQDPMWGTELTTNSQKAYLTGKYGLYDEFVSTLENELPHQKKPKYKFHNNPYNRINIHSQMKTILMKTILMILGIL